MGVAGEVVVDVHGGLCLTEHGVVGIYCTVVAAGHPVVFRDEPVVFASPPRPEESCHLRVERRESLPVIFKFTGERREFLFEFSDPAAGRGEGTFDHLDLAARPVEPIRVPDRYYERIGGENRPIRERRRRDAHITPVRGLDVGVRGVAVAASGALRPHGHVLLLLEVEERYPVAFPREEPGKEEAFVIAVARGVDVGHDRELRFYHRGIGLIRDRLDERGDQFEVMVVVEFFPVPDLTERREQVGIERLLVGVVHEREVVDRDPLLSREVFVEVELPVGRLCAGVDPRVGLSPDRLLAVPEGEGVDRRLYRGRSLDRHDRRRDHFSPGLSKPGEAARAPGREDRGGESECGEDSSPHGYQVSSDRSPGESIGTAPVFLPSVVRPGSIYAARSLSLRGG